MFRKKKTEAQVKTLNCNKQQRRASSKPERETEWEDIRSMKPERARVITLNELREERKHRIDEVGEGKCDSKCVQERTEVSVSWMLKQEKETSVKWISWHISQWERVLDSECTAVHWLIWCAVHLQHYWWVSERARHTGWHTHTMSNTMTVGWVDSTPSVWVDNCWRWVGDNDSYIGEGSTSR